LISGLTDFGVSSSLYLFALIFVNRRCEDILARRRELLTFELALQAERELA
jgi:hypothetical protein